MGPLRSRPASLLGLAFAAGALDAISYLGFGHVFTANMTGNTVLLAIAGVRGVASDAAHSATALGGFALGVAIAAAVIPADGAWPRRAARIFWMQTLLLAASLLAWAVVGVPASRYWLIAVVAAAMGVQSVAVRASHVSGVNTTYMTSTYLNAIARAVMRARGIEHTRDAGALPGSAWLIYALGGVVGALAEQAWQAGSIGIPLGILVGVSIWATLHPGSDRSEESGSLEDDSA